MEKYPDPQSMAYLHTYLLNIMTMGPLELAWLLLQQNTILLVLMIIIMMEQERHTEHSLNINNVNGISWSFVFCLDH